MIPRITFKWHKCECGHIFSPAALELYAGKCFSCGAEIPVKPNMSFDVFTGQDIMEK